MYKLVSLLLIVLTITPFPFHAYAEGKKVADISKGQKAPFTGVLMSENLAAKLYLDSKFSPRECDIKLEEKVRDSKIKFDRQISLLESKLEIQEDKFESIIRFKDNRIDFLEKRWSPRPWYESGEFWFSAGVLSGIILTVAAGYAVGQASN